MGAKTKLIRKSTLLEILGISESRLYQLEKDGIAEKKGDGYKVIETLKNYVEMTKKRNGGITSETLSLSELAILLGIAERTVRELAMKGIIKKEDTGVYKLKESVQNYMNYKLGGDEDLALKKKADREIREIALIERKQHLTDTLVKKAEVKKFLSSMVIVFKDTLLSYPDRLQAEKKIELPLKKQMVLDFQEMLEEIINHEY